jgi:hypothetical protein
MRKLSHRSAREKEEDAMFGVRHRYYRLLFCVLFLLSGGLPGEVTQAHPLEPPPPRVSATRPAHSPTLARDSTYSTELAAVSAFEHSLALDGDGDFVDIPHDPALNLTDGNGLTIEAWINRVLARCLHRRQAVVRRDRADRHCPDTSRRLDPHRGGSVAR